MWPFLLFDAHGVPLAILGGFHVLGFFLFESPTGSLVHFHAGFFGEDLGLKAGLEGILKVIAKLEVKQRLELGTERIALEPDNIEEGDMCYFLGQIG